MSKLCPVCSTEEEIVKINGHFNKSCYMCPQRHNTWHQDLEHLYYRAMTHSEDAKKQIEIVKILAIDLAKGD